MGGLDFSRSNANPGGRPWTAPEGGTSGLAMSGFGRLPPNSLTDVVVLRRQVDPNNGVTVQVRPRHCACLNRVHHCGGLRYRPAGPAQSTAANFGNNASPSGPGRPGAVKRPSRFPM
jgi:hypothetical protein